MERAKQLVDVVAFRVVSSQLRASFDRLNKFRASANYRQLLSFAWFQASFATDSGQFVANSDRTNSHVRSHHQCDCL